MSSILGAIIELYPEAKVIVTNEDYDLIEWLDGNPNDITLDQIKTKKAELDTAEDALAYARNREREYPSIDELTVALYDSDDKAALDAKRAAIKAKWPKDNSGPVGVDPPKPTACTVIFSSE